MGRSLNCHGWGLHCGSRLLRNSVSDKTGAPTGWDSCMSLDRPFSLIDAQAQGPEHPDFQVSLGV